MKDLQDLKSKPSRIIVFGMTPIFSPRQPRLGSSPRIYDSGASARRWATSRSPLRAPPSLIRPVTHPDVISREGFMHFNLTPLIIISRTSRFSLWSCPSQDKHNLFAIKPNKYVCVGDETVWERGSGLGRAPALPASEGWLGCVSLSPCPGGSHCPNFQAGGQI